MAEDLTDLITACALLRQAIALLDTAGEEVEAANLSATLERLTQKFGISAASPESGAPH